MGPQSFGGTSFAEEQFLAEYTFCCIAIGTSVEIFKNCTIGGCECEHDFWKE
jgi:hypothetical protein